MDNLAGFTLQLAELGIDLTLGAPAGVRAGVQQAAVHLRRGASGQEYCLFYGPDAKFHDVQRPRDAGASSLLLTPYASPRTAAAMRRAGVQYLDSAGNAWIAFGAVLIDIRGRPRNQDTGQPLAPSGNLFSAGRAQVVCVLLTWPALWELPRRDVARAAGVSVGQAHNTLALLEHAGHGAQRVRGHPTQLLELWAGGFPTGLASRLALATYSGDVTHPHADSPDEPLYLSGAHAIPERLRPATLTLYVQTLNPRLAINNRWRADGPPNIVIRRKFWTAPHGPEPTAATPSAPWPLVYADLLNSADPRVRQEAAAWKDRFA